MMSDEREDRHRALLAAVALYGTVGSYSYTGTLGQTVTTTADEFLAFLRRQTGSAE